MIGRKEEQRILEQCLLSPRPEFLVVYGRRRIGKTFLVKEYFHGRFSFYATGVSGEKMNQQLRAFTGSLRTYGYAEKTAPKDWYEAFSLLRELLEKNSVIRDSLTGKRVIFLDELPWMDTPRSDFKSALDYFWNSWASSQKDLFLIVCGSATSWIIDNLLGDRGGFYNRITRQIHLQPFSLKECESLFALNGVVMNRAQVMESYMVFGGVPYYLNCFDRRLSLAQNIDELCFKESGQLYYEYDRLFRSLFRHSEKHIAIVEALSVNRGGVTRKQLASIKKIGDGEPLTKALSELEQCGFIRKYRNFVKEKQGHFYQLVDPFTLFCLKFRRENGPASWMSFISTPGYCAWCGNSFELVCLLHIRQIKAALGISGVETTEASWRSASSEPGAQIDLLIDRRDQIINLCEMKYSMRPFEIDRAYEQQLRNKIDAFRKEALPEKALHLTLISANGLAGNAYSGIVQTLITAEELFQ